MTNSNDRLDRIEQILEGLAQNQRQIIQSQGEIVQSQGEIVQAQRGIVQAFGQIVQIQERQQDQIQILANTTARHNALIERLDAIIERMVYREGRGGNDGEPQA